MSVHRVLGTIFTVLAIATASRVQAQAAPDTASIAQATAAGSAWVSLLDAGELEASWDSAAPAFQAAVSRREWLQAVTQARGPFEPFGTRTLVSAQFHATLPNAPPGPYVILSYQTAVEGNRSVIETVVPMRLADGRWRVSGYFVRPPN
jgi:hypothetical protein